MSLKRLLKPRARKPNRASDPVRVVVGLRNPGADYEETRHNVGYEVLARYLNRAGERLGKAPGGIPGMSAMVGAGAERTLSFVPGAFMNRSGGPVRAVLDYHKVAPADLLVLHDDIDLPFGRLRLQVGGGSGGHNGVRSVEEALGTADFSRLKIGVGRPPGEMDPAHYVLRRFDKGERLEADAMMDDAVEVVERWTIDRARAQELAAHRGRTD